MNPTTPASNPLQGLRDLHLPAPVSWWPPAPGWWLLAGGIVLLLVLGFWWWRRRRRQRYQRQALHALQKVREAWQADKYETDLLATISILLRRVAITRYGRQQVASLYGKAWLDFLDSTGRGTNFRSQGQALLEAPYRPNSANAAQTVLDLATHWVKAQS